MENQEIVKKTILENIRVLNTKTTKSSSPPNPC
jgi:hypothetical protein